MSKVVDYDLLKTVYHRGETHADMSKVSEGVRTPIESFDTSSIYEPVLPTITLPKV